MSSADPGTLIADLRKRGIHVTLRAGRLRLEGSTSALTPELRQVLQERKEDLLAHLAAWKQHEACEMLAAMQGRLTKLLGGRPVPEMNLPIAATHDALIEAHDRRDWPAFVKTLAEFEEAWAGWIRRRQAEAAKTQREIWTI